MKIKCLIVDDEKSARDGLQILCSEHPELEIVGVCKNGIEAIDEIQALNPQLVLLDVQMPGVNGFEVLASISSPRPKVIFITAHDQFAIKAFEVNAIDYLLKPFSDERFDQAIKKAIDQIKLQQKQDLNPIINDPSISGQNKLKSNEDSRLILKVDGAIHLVPKSKIRLIEAYDYYIKIHVETHYYMLRDSMKNMEASLAKNDEFKRVHKSYIVNKAYISRIEKLSATEHGIVLTNGEQIKVSRPKTNEIKEWITR